MWPTWNADCKDISCTSVHFTWTIGHIVVIISVNSVDGYLFTIWHYINLTGLLPWEMVELFYTPNPHPHSPKVSPYWSWTDFKQKNVKKATYLRTKLVFISDFKEQVWFWNQTHFLGHTVLVLQINKKVKGLLTL